ncbi:MAG: hypothetical protein AAF696_19890 [Bacteroidota bacterium]
MNIKYALTLLSLFSLLSISGYAQNPFLKKLERKAKNKIQQRAERKADQAMDKGLDKIEEAIEKPGTKDKSKKSETSASSRAEAKEATQVSQEDKKPNKAEERKRENHPLFGQNKSEEVVPFDKTNFEDESVSEQGIIGQGPFGIRSGHFIQKTSLHNEMMKSVQWDTVYFSNFGQLQDIHQYSERHISMMGINRKEVSHSQFVHREGKIYSHDLEKGKGFVMENPAINFYQGMDEQQMKEFAGEIEANMHTEKERLGTERIAGKLCEVFEFTSHDEGGNVMMISRLWWWKGMLMKSHSRGMGSEIIQENIRMEEGGNISTQRFQPNPSIKYQHFSYNKY